MLVTTENGLYCPAGDFFVDPWRPVDRAVLTHGHADHARPGSRRYLAAADGLNVLRSRLGPEIDLQGLPYGEAATWNSVRVSFHPAGHILGSAQVRIEHRGEVWVVAGDYKTTPDPTCAAFEPVRCQVFITESTFGLPIYRWRPAEEIFADLNAWWAANQEAGRTTVLFAYALGKAQRLLAGLNPDLGPIFCHGAVATMNEAYRAAGVALPPTRIVTEEADKDLLRRALVVAPPSAQRSPWMRRFGDAATAFASGWMLVRGARRRRAVERGIVLSDHADWPGLLDAVAATGAERILVTHGHVPALVRWLREQGKDAAPLETRFEGEQDD